MIDPLFTLAAQWALGLLLLGAAWHKLRGWQVFPAIVDDYRLLPGFLIRPAAMLLVPLEALLGSAWLLAPYQLLLSGLTAALLGLYAAAIAINLLRGRRHIDCGCSFGLSQAAAAELSWWLVLRNGALAALAFLPALPQSGRELGVLDGFGLAAALLLAVLLLLALGQLQANRSAMQPWRASHD
jgi:hypothetical protein